MAMSRKDFEELADIVKRMGGPNAKRLAQELASMCARHNSRFNRSRFMDACGVDENQPPLSFDYIGHEFAHLNHGTDEHAKVKVSSIEGDTRWLDFPTAALGELENVVRWARVTHGLDD